MSDYRWDYPGWDDWGPPGPGPGMRMCPMAMHIHHVIQPGDTFYNLAQRYRVRTDDIVRLNPCADPNNLQVGEIVCIPCPHRPPMPPRPPGPPVDPYQK
ncbi:MAG: LysM peptidoglycan-binding domain-containing protein [Clostridia bacterium]|nr:LysM peptidoglycan-binding domain-containing protein [Clostridia bacterium]